MKMRSQFAYLNIKYYYIHECMFKQIGTKTQHVEHHCDSLMDRNGWDKIAEEAVCWDIGDKHSWKWQEKQGSWLLKTGHRCLLQLWWEETVDSPTNGLTLYACKYIHIYPHVLPHVHTSAMRWGQGMWDFGDTKERPTCRADDVNPAIPIRSGVSALPMHPTHGSLGPSGGASHRGNAKRHSEGSAAKSLRTLVVESVPARPHNQQFIS